MISVLIVDDEPAVCRLLRHLIRWEELDMTLSGFVYDGQEALELLEEKKPDIVITDICMPGKSGLELIQESQCRGYDISYIIISGYREFKFAKQAISLGVEDYLLKPLKEQEVNQILYRIGNQIRKKKTEEVQQIQNVKKLEKSIRQRGMELLLYQINENQGLSMWNQQYCFCFQSEFFQVWMIRIDPKYKEREDRLVKKELLQNTLEMLCGIFLEVCPDSEQMLMKQRGYILTNGGKEKELIEAAEKYRKKWGQEYKDYVLTIAASPIKNGALNIKDARIQAEMEMKRSLAEGIGRVYYSKIELAPQSVFSEAEKLRLTQALNSCSEESLIQTVKEILDAKGEPEKNTGIKEKEKTERDQNIERNCRRVENVELGITWIREEKKKFSQLEAEEEADRKENTEECTTLEELESLLWSECRNLILLIEKSRKLQISLPVRMIEQYLKNNFRENISLEEVAASVHLTPVYLSGLFKKETGKTFSDYLFEIRMEEAKRLLREDTVKIKDVAERSGYADSRYFSKVFSKAFGITPKEYRRLHCWRT